MLSTVSFASLAIAILARTTVAVPTQLPDAPASNAVLAVSGTQSYQIVWSDDPPPYVVIGPNGGPKSYTSNETTYGPNGTNALSVEKRDAVNEKRWLRCDHDESYVSGFTVFRYWSRNFCKSLFYNPGQNYTWTKNYVSLDVYLSDMKQWNNIGVSMYKGGDAGEFITQEQCYQGFNEILNFNIYNPMCQGYTGHREGDTMGNFYGGANGKAGVAEFYLYVYRAG